MSAFHTVTLICPRCEKQIPTKHIAVNALQGIRLVGDCPDCSAGTTLETTIENLIRNCQIMEINNAEINLAEVICNGPTH